MGALKLTISVGCTCQRIRLPRSAWCRLRTVNTKIQEIDDRSVLRRPMIGKINFHAQINQVLPSSNTPRRRKEVVDKSIRLRMSVSELPDFSSTGSYSYKLKSLSQSVVASHENYSFHPSLLLSPLPPQTSTHKRRGERGTGTTRTPHFQFDILEHLVCA